MCILNICGDIVPNYNVAPSLLMPIVTTIKPDVVTWGEWGFLPNWARGKTQIKSVINARAEGIEDKPFFREVIKKNRCLILADGFYEWKREGTTKVPYRFYLKTKEPFAMAGIFEEYKNKEGKIVSSYAIITTEANKLMKPIHSRMPVILSSDTEKDWLNHNLLDTDISTILLPYNNEDLVTCEVSSKVNAVRNNNASLLECQRS